MQENLTLARPYAQAAFEQALSERATAAWSDALHLLKAVASDANLRRVINDPRVGRRQLIDLLIELGGARFTPSFRNFVKVLTAARRLNVVGEISQLYERRLADSENVADAEIVTPFPLDAAATSSLARAVEKRLNKTVRITQRIDRELIGGAVVRVGDTIYDVSLKGGLDQLAKLFNRK